MEIKRKYYENRILKLLKEYNENFGLITESKKEILMDKIGMKPELAETFDRVCGKVAVWIANKYLKMYYDNNINLINYGMTKVDVLNAAKKKINELHPQRIIPVLVSIMDYNRAPKSVGGLDNKITSHYDKEASITDIIADAKIWHDSLGVGDGDINYQEPHTHNIIIDFRKDGEGYYWVELNTKNSNQECERMGHCGRSSYGYLYSLRSDKKIPNSDMRINQSHLTASIGTDGILYQLKGKKNSKPKEEYHKYIEPLFFALGGGGEEEDYLIQGFGSEYASNQDFKLTDLPDQTIRKLYNDRPELFKSRSLQKKLGEMGIIEVEPFVTTFTIEFDSSDIGYYLGGDFVYKTYNSKTPAGNDTKRKVYYYETIMSDDVWDVYNSDGGRWEENLYYVDSNNESKIREMINETDENISLKEMIEQYDDTDEIKNAISDAMFDIERDEHVQYLRDALETALNELGKVFEFNSEKIKIQIDLKDLFSDNEIDDYFETYEDCNDPKCLFGALLDEGSIDKPIPRFYDYWYADIDKDSYNDRLTDRLNNI